MATNFMAKFGYMCSFGRVVFENGVQYHPSDSKIFSDNILATFYANMMKNRSSNPRYYEGNKCTVFG